ncbi:MAG TPA: hypothetical protein VK655_12310, partial [Solirubrobacteraceae bacterium]|nr:hypothetical protein [Solirubrobacteraceae bacterium]
MTAPAVAPPTSTSASATISARGPPRRDTRERRCVPGSLEHPSPHRRALVLRQCLERTQRAIPGELLDARDRGVV